MARQPDPAKDTGVEARSRHEEDADADEDSDSQPGADRDDSELPERDGFGPLTWFAVLFMLAAIGYVGYAMMLDSQRRRTGEPTSESAPAEAAPAEASAVVDEAPNHEVPAALPTTPADTTPREDGLTFGTEQPGVRLEGSTVPAGHGVLHVLETSRPGVLVSVGDQDLGAPPQQIALPEGRHAVRYRVGGQVIDRYYFVRSAHTRVVPVPES